MASETNASGNHFVVTWIIENFSCFVLKKNEYLDSPCFTVPAPVKTDFCLSLYPKGEERDKKHVGYFLRNKGESVTGNIGSIAISFELQILNKNGLVTLSLEAIDNSIPNGEGRGWSAFFPQNDLVEKRKDLLHNDCLTLRARIWRTEEKLPAATHCIIRTRMHKEVISATLTVDNFSFITTDTKKIIWKPAASSESPKLKVNLSLSRGMNINQYLNIEVEVENSQKLKLIIASFSLLNAKGEKVNTKEDEIWLNTNGKPIAWKLPCFIQKEELTTKGYLKNDMFRLYAKLLLLKGVESQRIESYESGPEVSTDFSDFLRSVSNKNCPTENDTLSDLSHDFQSLQVDSLLSDVTLQVGTQTFPAHRNVLRARSPIFKAMFNSYMKENAEGIVHIKDVDGVTLQSLLDFIYTGFVGELQLEAAKKLYVAADKYEVLLLMKKCRDYLQEKLSLDNVCDFFLLADMHNDGILKTSVQEFFVHNYSQVLETNSWRSFTKSNGNLAVELCEYQMLSDRKGLNDN